MCGVLLLVFRLFPEEQSDSTADSSKAQVSPLRTSTSSVSKVSELVNSTLAAADSSIECSRSTADTLFGLGGIRNSAERPQHSGVSRPGRDGIKLNSDTSRMLSLVKKSDSAVSLESKPDVQGLSYNDKFSEFVSHGQRIKFPFVILKH